MEFNLPNSLPIVVVILLMTKEKYDDDMSKVYHIRGTAGGDRINYDGSTKANTAAMPTVKILSQSVLIL